MQVSLLPGCTATPTNVDDPSEWDLVGDYNFPERGVQARVFSIVRTSTLFHPNVEEIEQTKILLRAPDFDGEFTWPGGSGPATTACEALAQEDGSIAFFLSSGPSNLRVVTFRDKTFRFRAGSDELESTRNIQLRDLDGDSRAEYIIEDICGDGALVPDVVAEQAVWCTAPRVFAWETTGGFVDESDRFPAYFRQEVLPELEARVRAAKSEDERRGRELALEFVRASVGKVSTGASASAPGA